MPADRVVMVREGEHVTFPCTNNTDDLGACGPNSWAVLVPRSPQQLITGGHSGNYRDRLSVGDNCDLELQEVSAEDAGMYICGDAGKILFVVSSEYLHLLQRLVPDG